VPASTLPPNTIAPPRVTFTSSADSGCFSACSAGGSANRSSAPIFDVAIMKITSSTIMMSAIGVTLISARTAPFAPPTLMDMAISAVSASRN
jgi:hypothetical protein